MSDELERERRTAEAVRRACIDAAIEGYERAAMSGLCHEGAWESAISAIRMLDLDELLGEETAETEDAAGSRAGEAPAGDRRR